MKTLTKTNANVKGNLKPNLGQARRFLSKLTGEKDPRVTYQIFDDQKKGRVKPEHFSGTLTECQAKLIAENLKGAGIYIMVNAGDLKGRSGENVISVRAGFVDLDGAPLQPVKDAPVKPHIIVESSPGRYQVYWLVPDCTLEQFTPIQEALAEMFHGDPKVKDLCRVMRLPGFYHMKADPVMTTTYEVEPMEPYKTSEVISGLGLVLEPKRKLNHTPKTDLGIVFQGVPHGERDDLINRFVWSRLARGISQAEVTELVLAAAGRCTPPFDEKEALKKITRAVAKFASRDSLPEAQNTVRNLINKPDKERRTAAFEPMNIGALAVVREKDPALFLEFKDGAEGYIPEIKKAIAKTRLRVTQLGEQAPAAGDTGDLPVGKAFRPLPYVKHILATNHVISCAGEFYRWTKSAGYYQPWPHEEITELLIDWMDNEIRAANVKEIKQLLLEHTAKQQDEINPENLLCLQKNILDYETGEFIDHTPDLYLMSQFPIEFVPNATSPTYDKFLNVALPGSAEQDLWHEICAYALIRDTRYRKGFLLYDDDIGNTGKSTLGEVLGRVLGPNHYSTVRLEDLASKFKIPELHRKHVNISTEVNVKSYLDDSIVKNLITGEEFEVERKFKQPFKMKNFAKLIVTANRFPNTYDSGDPFYERWVILQFFHKFPMAGEKGNIPHFSQTLSQAELNGVFLKAVMGLKRLRDHEGFTVPPSTIEANAEFRRQTNPIADFAYQCLRITEGGQLGDELKEIYEAYQVWYKENIGEKAYFRKRRFKKELQKVTRREFFEDTATKARILPGVTIRLERECREV